MPKNDQTLKSEQFLSGIYAGTDPSYCNQFLIEVARQLGIKGGAVPEDLANNIIDYISVHSEYWMKIGEGAKDGQNAAKYANDGYLVVAILKGKDHTDHRTNGHVAIVLPPPMLGDYPRVICAGSVAGRSDGSKAVRGVWKGVDAPNVKYYRTLNTFGELKGK